MKPAQGHDYPQPPAGRPGQAPPRGQVSGGPAGGGRAGKALRRLTLALIILFSAGVFLYRLDRYPVNIGPYEGIAAVAAIRIAEGDAAAARVALNRSRQPNYGSRGIAWNPFLVYPMAAVYRLAGFDPGHIGIRLVPVAYGVLSVAAVYLLMAGMFGPGPGLASAFLLAASSWFISLSRLCSDFSATIFYSILCFLIYSRAGRNLIIHALLGGVLALGSYFYPPARFSAAGVFLSAGIRCVFERGYLRSRWFALALMLLSFQGACYLQGMDAVGYFTLAHRDRTNEAFWKQQTRPPLETLKFHCQVFYQAFFTKWGWTGSSIAYERQISLDPVSRWLVVAGALLALLRIRNHKYRLLLIWLLFAALPMIVSNARGKRGLLVIPALSALASVGLFGVIEMLTRWTAWFKGAPSRAGKAAGAVAALGVLLYAGKLNLENYFGEYVKAEKGFLAKRDKWPQWAQVLELMKASDVYTDCWQGEASDTGEYLACSIGRGGHLHQFKANEARERYDQASGPAVLFLHGGKAMESKPGPAPESPGGQPALNSEQ